MVTPVSRFCRRRHPFLSFFAAFTLLCGSGVDGQSHAVSFQNNCGFGVPTLDQRPSKILATGTGTDVFRNTTILNTVAFLNTGFCGPNGGNCTVVDISLGSPDGCSVAVDLIPTNVFSVPVGFSYYNACDGAGVSCLDSQCVNAVRDVGDMNGAVNCIVDPNHSASVLVTFCPHLATPTLGSSATATQTGEGYYTVKYVPIPTIVGAVIGSVGGTAVIAIAICYLRRRMRRVKQAKKELELATAPTPYYDSAPTTAHGSIPPSKSQQMSQYSQNTSYSRPVTQGSQQGSGMNDPVSTRYSSYDVRNEPDLDRIVEGLAQRFGWTVPPPQAASAPHAAVDPLPNYQDLPV